MSVRARRTRTKLLAKPNQVAEANPQHTSITFTPSNGSLAPSDIVERGEDMKSYALWPHVDAAAVKNAHRTPRKARLSEFNDT